MDVIDGIENGDTVAIVVLDGVGTLNIEVPLILKAGLPETVVILGTVVVVIVVVAATVLIVVVVVTIDSMLLGCCDEDIMVAAVVTAAVAGIPPKLNPAVGVAVVEEGTEKNPIVAVVVIGANPAIFGRL